VALRSAGAQVPLGKRNLPIAFIEGEHDALALNGLFFAHAAIGDTDLDGKPVRGF